MANIRIFKVGSRVARRDTGAMGRITKIGPKYAQVLFDDSGLDLRRTEEVSRKSPSSYPIPYKYLRLEA